MEEEHMNTDVTTLGYQDCLATLAAIVGEPNLIVDRDLVAGYSVDWTRRFSGPALAVVRPGAVVEVSEVLAACSRAGLPVIPQGGNTSMVGGSVPAPAGVPPLILSTLRLRRMEPVDDLAGAVTVGAGVTLAELSDHVRRAGWRYGVDLAARDTATIGGTCATNAGGIRVCAYGMTREQVLGCEFVRADGSIISRLDGLPKDNTGYHLTGLMVGSEGTLGVITAVRLRLHRPVGATTVALVGVPDMAAALELVEAAVPTGERLLAAEIIDAEGIRLVHEVAGLHAPLAQEWPYVLLLEVSGDWLDLPEDSDAVVAMDTATAGRLWEYRERQPDAISALGVAHKLDISVPLPRLDQVAKAARSCVPGDARVVIFGHLRDGNLHVEIAGVPAGDTELDRAIFAITAEAGGVLSAEHGVGRAKAQWLHLSRSEAEIQTMWDIKHSLDPAGVLNPGALLARK
jgi:FAD/FMN-containing dehydrogenase